MNVEIDNYGLGWAFFCGGGVKGGSFLPLLTDDLEEWVKGFMAAQADYDVEPQEFNSIESALIGNGVSGELLSKLLESSEKAFNSDEWLRLPSVPLRGKAKSKANLQVV